MEVIGDKSCFCGKVEAKAWLDQIQESKRGENKETTGINYSLKNFAVRGGRERDSSWKESIGTIERAGRLDVLG